MQSVSTVQLALQAVAPQMYGVHAVVDDAGQVPVPLQLAALTAVPAEQVPARQPVEPPGYAQAMAIVPSQEPPQALPSVVQAVRLPCGAPVVFVQVPTLPVTSQAWHCPPQALLQQTPSTQLPAAHSLPAPQTVP
jgi:hypothetical protein